MKILFRTDSSIKIGSGHVSRCLSLASALKTEGHQCIFACRDLRGNSIKKIRQFGFEVMKIKNSKYENKSINMTVSENYEIDVKCIIRRLKKNFFDWVIIDHYSLNINWEKKIRPYVKKIMVIDDFVNRKHSCDLLLNQSYGVTKEKYKNLLPKRCKLLLGSKYALINHSFLKARSTLKLRGQPIKRALIYFGSGIHTIKYIKIVIKIFSENFFSNFFLDIVVDKNIKKSSVIIKTLKKKKNIKVHYNLPDLSDLMSKADFSIGTAGSTTWERCCLGLPTILIYSASNQKLNAKAMKKTNAAIVLRPNKYLEKKIKESCLLLCRNRKVYLKISKKAFSICDGNGIDRVVKNLNSNEPKKNF